MLTVFFDDLWSVDTCAAWLIRRGYVSNWKLERDPQYVYGHWRAIVEIVSTCPLTNAV